jgi:hypothetical protein
MQVLEEAVGASANPWALRRERATELAKRYPHAAEILRLYQALIDHLPPSLAWAGRGGGLNFEDIVSFAVDHVLPGIVDATVASGPVRLREGVIGVFCTADLPGLIRGWLENESLTPFETYLARASISPLLEALPNKSLAALDGKIPSRLVGEGQGAGFCPTCGGLPQVSYFAVSGEALVSGPRYLVCSRCATNWIFSRMTCAGCGETDGTKLPIFQDDTQLPHMRVDGCRTCNRYLLTVDLRRDARAVPIVDELAALPLDLYATDQGLTKITPNLMGN